MSDFAADDLSLPFHLHNFRSMSLHHWSELWLVAGNVENSSTLLQQMADTIKSDILYCTFSPDGGYNKVKTLVGQVGEVWHTVLVVFGRNNGFTGWGRSSSASLKTRVEKDKAARSCAMTRYAPLHSTWLLGGKIEVEREGALAPNGLLLC